MPKTTQEQKALLGMAGEFLVAAELNRRNIHAAVTYGSSKATDIYAFHREANAAIRIEVKTTLASSKKWILGHKAAQPQNWMSNVFYVLVQLPPPIPPTEAPTVEMLARHTPRFYVLASPELGRLLQREHQRYLAAYRDRNKREFTAKGVPQLPTHLASPYENQWEKIENAVAGSVSA